ncbi:hypothetical protein NB460_04870 [Clostridioides difficile]|uniref:hypothetical protein n=1 Tax=Clostridioides difficile TaxID=1496 RepID=UPI0020301B61|nr:hypothetical protein [Clostridioides difficile]MCM0740876.1 hypothetical protein [Clostridioides difficile]
MNKDIKLTKKELHCVVRHLQIYLKIENGEQVSLLPCQICNYLRVCGDCNTVDKWSALKKIANMADLEINEFLEFNL